MKCPQCEHLFDPKQHTTSPVCQRCGAATAFTLMPPSTSTSAIQNDALVLRDMGQGGQALPETYADWDEFRRLSPTLQRILTAQVIAPRPDLGGSDTSYPSKDLFDLIEPEHGKLLGELKPQDRFWYSTRVAAVVLVIVLLAAGWIAGGWWLLESRNEPVWIANFFLTPVLIACLTFFFWQFGRHKLTPLGTVWLFENGLLAESGTQFDSCTWDSVPDLRIDSANGCRVLNLRLLDGLNLTISAADSPESGAVAEFIEVKSCSALLLPKLHRLLAGNRLRFGELHMDRKGIETPSWYAAWTEIRRVTANAAFLMLESSTREGVLTLPAKDISFLPLVVSIIEVIMDEHHRLPSARVITCVK